MEYSNDIDFAFQVVKYCLGDNPVTLPELNTKSSSKGTNGNNGWKLPSSHRFFPTAAEVDLVNLGTVRFSVLLLM